MRIPPPVLAVTIAAVTIAASRFMTSSWPFSAYLSYPALAVALFGTVIDLSSKRLFATRETTVNPMTPGAATVIVDSGAYRWSRNPMYLGRLLQLLALSLYLASPIGLICVPIFAIYLDRVQIRAEERALSERFPMEFAEYCSRVRRWV
jgi:protein-S-isoprenylcysteine O-methyltransferase Ste14